MSSESLLEVAGLSKSFVVEKRLFGENRLLKALKNISFQLEEGKTLALVGESGCGKSTLAKVLLRLLDADSGTIRFQGQDVLGLRGKKLRQARQNMQMIFQDPFSSLNPRLKVFDLIAEPLRIHGLAGSAAELEKKVDSLLTTVGMPTASSRKYPHEFSGGQRQRIGIARALALNPKLIIADEPVSALDVSIQSQILNLLKEIKTQYRLTMMFISHDLAVVEFISDRVAVMYLGEIVELGDVKDIFREPQHPYTQALLAAIPGLQKDKENHQSSMEISVDLPSPIDPPSGCHFHPRCPFAFDRCVKESPVLRDENSKRHYVACHLVAEGTEKGKPH